MAVSLTALRGIQISSPETVSGTAVAAAEVLCGGLYSTAYTDKIDHFPEEDKNTLALHLGNEFPVQELGALSITGNMNMRHAVWAFANALCGNVTASQPNAVDQPNAYLWAFQPGITTANTPDIAAGIDTFTYEVFDNIQAYELPYCFTTSLSLTGAPGEPVTYTQEITANSISETTKTPALTSVATQYFPSNLVKFYIDSTYAGIGGTQKTDLLQSWTWTLETMFTPRFNASGVLGFAGINEAKKSVELEMTYLRSTASELEKNKYDTNAYTYLRIAILGATELDSGEANVPYIYLDGAYKYHEWGEPSDNDGAQEETVTAMSTYDATSSMQHEVAVYNNMAAYP